MSAVEGVLVELLDSSGSGLLAFDRVGGALWSSLDGLELSLLMVSGWP